MLSSHNVLWNKHNEVENQYIIISLTYRNFSNVIICSYSRSFLTGWLKKLFSIYHKIIALYQDRHSRSLRVFKRLLTYFNGTTISTFFALPAAGLLPIAFTLDFNYSESVVEVCGSSLQYYHKLPEIFQ